MSSFEKLPIGELRRIADEVYPVVLDEEETKDKKKAAEALKAVGANWNEYLTLHAPEDIREKFAPEPEEPAPGVVTSAQVTGNVPVVEEEVKIITKEETKVAQTEKYLVKMERTNPVFEIGKYRFTKDHPYALVDGADLKHVLSSEEGFRQAYPDEIEDFYS